MEETSIRQCKRKGYLSLKKKLNHPDTKYPDTKDPRNQIYYEKTKPINSKHRGRRINPG